MLGRWSPRAGSPKVLPAVETWVRSRTRAAYQPALDESQWSTQLPPQPVQPPVQPSHVPLQPKQSPVQSPLQVPWHPVQPEQPPLQKNQQPAG